MFYGSKAQFEQQKKEFRNAAQRLWLTEPFYFMRTDFNIRIIEVVRQVEDEIGIDCLSSAGGEDVLKYKTEVLNYQHSVILSNSSFWIWILQKDPYTTRKIMESFWHCDKANRSCSWC